MQISISYIEITQILDKFVAEPAETEKIKFTFHPVSDGLKIKFERLKWKLFNFKKSAQVEIRNFEDDILQIKLEINGFLLDLVKKFLMEKMFNLLKNKMKDEEADFTDYIEVSKSYIYIQLNGLLKLMDIPVFVEDLTSKEDRLEVSVKVLKLKQ